MSQRKIKGTRRPDPTVKRQGDRGYVLKGGIPWPEFHDGTQYADRLSRVVHADWPDAGPGTIGSIEWAHPDGAYMNGAARTIPATKTRPEQPRPGAWWATVSWDDRDHHPEPVKCLVANLVPLDPPA